MARQKTRRQEIISQQQSDLRRIIVIAALLFVILILALTSFSNCSGEEEVTDAPAPVQTSQYSPLPENITSYPKLVNSEYTLASSYIPSDLSNLFGIPDGTQIKLRSEAARAFEQLYSAMLADGLAIIPLSGYRSYSEQVALFDYNLSVHMENGMTEDEARRRVMETIALPGASEHQSGLAIDVTTDGTTQHDFQHTDQGIWLIDNAHLYGFIIRYPEDKVSITGINYEPWHLRYVGTAHAQYIHENDLCLEEYIVIVQKQRPGAVEENI